MFGSLISNFGGFSWTLIAFVVALSIIVAIHEYGHYIVGRWCGIKADVFSIGFGPTLFSRTDRHGTQWQVAALPLGGYVKFRGDANAASVGEDGTVAQMSEAERAQTMTGAALWKRAATVLAGPVANFILSIAIFAGVALVFGRAVDTPVVGELDPLPEDIVYLQAGDEVLSVNGKPVESLVDLSTVGADVVGAPAIEYEVRRGGRALTVEAAPPTLPRAASVQPRSAAWNAGLREGDVIRAIDGTPIHSFAELQAAVKASGGQVLELEVWRPGEGDLPTIALKPRPTDIPLPDGGFEQRLLIGLGGALPFEPATESVGPLEAVGAGVDRTVNVLTQSISALGHIVAGKISTCNLSGPIGIAQMSGATASMGADSFILFIAALSAAVGMLNLFPIPVLDGGHLVFHGYEAIRGRPPSDGAVRVLMGVGIALMLALMLFATFSDAFCPGGLFNR